MIKQGFLKRSEILLICLSIFFAGCSAQTDSEDANSSREDGSPGNTQTSSFSTTEIRLDGDPSGGQLEIFIFNTIVRIPTLPEDSIEKVADRIVESINTDPALQKQAIKGNTEGSRLILTNVREYDFWMCTTDKGVIIPEKPIDLSCRIEPDGHLVIFEWNNPEGGYDRIHIVENGMPIAESLPGTSTSFKYDYLNPQGYVYEGKHVYRVVGVKGGIPSCPSICEIFLMLP